MAQLRAQISGFRCIETKTDQSWIYYVGGGSGSGFQDPVGHRHMINDNDMQHAFATAFLNQLEDMDVDVTGHHRRLMARQAVCLQLEILP